jgi:hypothetical protein
MCVCIYGSRVGSSSAPVPGFGASNAAVGKKVLEYARLPVTAFDRAASPA